MGKNGNALYETLKEGSRSKCYLPNQEKGCQKERKVGGVRYSEWTRVIENGLDTERMNERRFSK